MSHFLSTMDRASTWLYRITTALACLVFTIGLVAFALIGTTSRYLQDDYCYSVHLAGDNFFLEQYDSYMHQTAYSGNRYSLTLGMGLSEFFGQGSVTVLPGLVLVLWLFGLYALIRRISSQTNLIGPTRPEAFITSEAVALFTLSLAPNWIQVFFWRPGMFPYFAPIVTVTYLILLVIMAGQAGKKLLPLLLAGIFLLAVLTGGFSETAASVQTALLAILLGISFFWPPAKRMALPTGIALLGSAAALALLIASPTNAPRLAMAYGAANSLPATILNSLDGAFYFYIFTAYRPTLLYASALIFFGLLGLIDAALRKKTPLSRKQFAVYLFAVILIAYLLTVAAVAPSFYAESSYPGKRALVIPAFISVLLAAAAGLLTGNFLAGWLKGRRFTMVLILAGVGIIIINTLWQFGMSEHFYPPAYPDMRSFLTQNWGFLASLAAGSAILFGLVAYKWKTQAVLALLVSIYLIQPLLMGARILHEYPILQRRAALWDGRQSEIIRAAENGEMDLEVRALDSLVGLTDLSENPGYWVNNCAADYYGLNSIRGVQPVLDPEPLVNP